MREIFRSFFIGRANSFWNEIKKRFDKTMLLAYIMKSIPVPFSSPFRYFFKKVNHFVNITIIIYIIYQ